MATMATRWGYLHLWLAAALGLGLFGEACTVAGTMNEGGAAPSGDPQTDTAVHGSTPGATSPAATSPGDGSTPEAVAGTTPSGTPSPVGGAGGTQPNTALAPNTPTRGLDGNGLAQQANLIYESRLPYALVGRFDASNANQIRFNFAGSKIGVAFTGTSLAVRITDSATDTFDVVIDGVEYASSGNAWVVDPAAAPVPCAPVGQVSAWDGNSYPGCVLATKSANPAVPISYPIATNLADGNHVAWLTKRTEFKTGQGTVTLWGFDLAPNGRLLAPPPYLRRRIEVLGDSSTSGYGAAQRSPCTENARTHDAGHDLPTYLASYLHAERVNLSISGESVYYSFFNPSVPGRLPPLYKQTIGFAASPAYDFTSDHVDAVVLSAGGDDLWGAAGKGVFTNPDGSTTNARAGFVASYVDMLATIRSVRPDATIFATLVFAASGNDIPTLGGAIQEAVASRQAAGDANVVYYAYFPANDPVRNPKGYVSLSDVVPGEKLWYGCAGHSSPGVSKYLTTLIGPAIAERMNWKDVGP